MSMKSAKYSKSKIIVCCLGGVLADLLLFACGSLVTGLGGGLGELLEMVGAPMGIFFFVWPLLFVLACIYKKWSYWVVRWACLVQAVSAGIEVGIDGSYSEAFAKAMDSGWGFYFIIYSIAYIGLYASVLAMSRKPPEQGVSS